MLRWEAELPCLQPWTRRPTEAMLPVPLESGQVGQHQAGHQRDGWQHKQGQEQTQGKEQWQQMWQSRWRRQWHWQ